MRRKLHQGNQSQSNQPKNAPFEGESKQQNSPSNTYEIPWTLCTVTHGGDLLGADLSEVPSNCTHIIIPECVERISVNFFDYFSAHGEITHITIPSSVRHIDGNAFASFSNLTTVFFKKVRPLDEFQNIKCVDFVEDSVIEMIATPEEGISNIDPAAFKGCDRLNKIVVGSNSCKEHIKLLLPQELKGKVVCRSNTVYNSNGLFSQAADECNQQAPVTNSNVQQKQDGRAKKRLRLI